TGPMAGRRLTLTAKSYTMGRKHGLDLTLDDGMCSGEHAALRFTGGAWTIVDLDSSNGTWLNEAKISTSVLSSGDLVQLGGTGFIFHGDGAAEKKSADIPPPTPAASSDELALVEKMRGHADRIRNEVGKVIVGQLD